MSKVGRWSTAAGSNNQATPNGWPEGQLPSTVNDCAREMMAAIRTMIIDAQFIDQDFSPTYITSSSFSVPGNQTSAIQIGRRLKMFDATAGVQQIIFGTVVSVSFTAVTTVHIESDSGSLTSSLSSFGISIISNNNNALPRNSDMTISSLAVTGNMSISGAVALGGAVQMGSTLSVSGEVSIARLVAKNTSLTCVAAGGFICTGDVTAFSDPRLKSDWKAPIPDLIERTAKLQSGIYTRIDSGYKQAGVNAAELKEFFPEVVHGTPPDYLSVAYGNAAMVICVELAKRVLALEKLLRDRK